MATAPMEESTIAIVEQIQKCPSVALSYFMHTQVEELKWAAKPSSK